jgi:3-methyladenine DNA glycosylase AlkD
MVISIGLSSFMNPHHKKILQAIQREKGRGNTFSDKDSYMLSGHFYYDISVPVRREIVKEWMKLAQEISDKELIAVIDSLYKGHSHEEKSMASALIGYYPKIRKSVSFKVLDAWLGELVGWAEIDGLCQSTFTAEEMLPKWNEWERFIRRLSKDKNINKRRASLVFLTWPIAHSADKRIIDLSFEMTEALKHEKPIIITKAISWLLRSGVKYHKKAIAEYLKKNKDSLPKIAVRETARKIKTGRK